MCVRWYVSSDTLERSIIRCINALRYTWSRASLALILYLRLLISKKIEFRRDEVCYVIRTSAVFSVFSLFFFSVFSLVCFRQFFFPAPPHESVKRKFHRVQWPLSERSATTLVTRLYLLVTFSYYVYLRIRDVVIRFFIFLLVRVSFPFISQLSK